MAEQLGYEECQLKFDELMDDYAFGDIKSESLLRRRLNGIFLRLHKENKLDILDAWEAKTPRALIGKMIRNARKGRRIMERADS